MEGVFISELISCSKYPWLWCLITYETVQLSCQDPRRGHLEQRNLKNIEEDYKKFVADGLVTSRLKFYHNVIHVKLLDIELEKVSILSTYFFAYSDITGQINRKHNNLIFSLGLCSLTSYQLECFQETI